MQPDRVLKVTLVVLVLIMHSGDAASPEEIAALADVAAALDLPTNFWNFSTDPCQGQWKGITCCKPNSSSSCCNSRLGDPCERTESASITTLSLYASNFAGTISPSVSRLSSLLNLDLSHNQLVGPIPPSIANLTALNHLSLGANRLTGSIPTELGNMVNLKELYLDNNPLTGPIPPLGRLRKLTSLHLRDCALSGEILQELGNVTSLTELELHSNFLKGTIPSSLANLKNLLVLKLSNNELSGQVDYSVFQNMHLLQVLFLQRNSFTGPVPPFSKLDLPELYYLDMRFNKLSGSIPSSLGELHLQYLFLSHNNLTGSIPESFRSLTNLTMLDISHNSLTGSLDNLEEVGKLAFEAPQIDFSFNFLEVDNSLPLHMVEGNNTQFNCRLSTPANVSASPPCARYLPGQFSGFAINAGSDSPIQRSIMFDADSVSNASTGFTFGPDNSNWALEVSGRFGGYVLDATANVTNFYNVEDDLFKSMRWSSYYLAYHGSLLKPGTYNVTIYFAEIVFSQTGYRVFDVFVQKNLVAKNLDVFALVGSKASYALVTQADVTEDGILSLEFIYGGPDRQLYSKVGSTGPMVSAISVQPAQVQPSDRNSPTKIALSVASALLAIIILGIAFGILQCRKRRPSSTTLPDAPDGPSSSSNKSLPDVAPRLYGYQELFDATSGFSEHLKLGHGGFGVVYKGTLHDGSVVAIKQLTRETQEGKADFNTEIAILCKVQHRNLLSIHGYCIDSEVPMLVCEYMENRSLDKLLFANGKVLSWKERRKIAVGVACGLAYLHDECRNSIIHCDIKPANILLDKRLTAKISDFGLARLYDATSILVNRSFSSDEEDQRQDLHMTTSKVGGTVGYVAPEYWHYLHLSTKVDVYSFGIVLLELLSGRRLVEFDTSSELSRDPQELLHLVDERLDGQYEMHEAIDMATIAMQCTQRDPSLRPHMRKVWLMLNGAIKIPELEP